MKVKVIYVEELSRTHKPHGNDPISGLSMDHFILGLKTLKTTEMPGNTLKNAPFGDNWL